MTSETTGSIVQVYAGSMRDIMAQDLPNIQRVMRDAAALGHFLVEWVPDAHKKRWEAYCSVPGCESMYTSQSTPIGDITCPYEGL